MYVNGKMRPTETISGMGGDKENDGGDQFKCDIFDMFEELLQMPQYTPSTTIKNIISNYKK
jgi:hypothetical protein